MRRGLSLLFLLAFGFSVGCGPTADPNAPPPKQLGSTGAFGKETRGNAIMAPIGIGPPLANKK